MYIMHMDILGTLGVVNGGVGLSTPNSQVEISPKLPQQTLDYTKHDI